MAQKRKEAESDLVATSRLVDQELAYFEALVRAATREPLNARRRLQQTVQEIRGAGECQARIGDVLRRLVATFEATAARNQELERTLRERAEELERRHVELAALEERIAGLGARGADLSARLLPLREVFARAAAEGRKPDAPEVLAVAAELRDLSSAAADLERDALAARFGEIVREAQSIHQRLAKLASTLEGLAPPA